MAELFQSTPPQGGDTYDTYAKMKRYKFQSTPPQGGDLSGVRISLPHCYFNPHHRKVVTTDSGVYTHSDVISIHTTARW